MLIKEMKEELRPREKLLASGVESLSIDELIAIILKTGSKSKSVKDLSLEVINLVNNLEDIKIESLTSIKGIGKVKAIELIASIELGKRIFLNKNKEIRKRYKNSKSIYEDMKYLFYNKKQEYFYCLYFNNRNELIERKLLFMGTINRSIVHPREIFKEAYLQSASGIICMHNHPTGDITPSKEDIYFTKNLVELGKMNDIRILDHIIVSDNDYYSFNDNGIINF
mgnify:CR=1 FL=1